MSLCSRCSSFDIQSFTEDGFPGRGYNLLEVIRAAERERCSFCSLLVEQINLLHDLRPYLSHEIKSQGTESLSTLNFFRHRVSTIFRRLLLIALPQWVHFSVERNAGHRNIGQNSLNITAIIAAIAFIPNTQEGDVVFGLTNIFGDEDKQIRLQVAADLGTPALQSGDIVGTLSLNRSTWSPPHYQTIKDWHHHCQQHHGACNKSITGHEEIWPDDVPLPTRCVEFEFLDKRNMWTSSVQWTLRETEGERGKYMTLSHRWAQETGEASTTKENYSYRADAWNQAQGYHLLARGKLTALFLDVGRLACHLGIRFVWIDSLCIIQDDKEDWVRESNRMADYYQRSWLTVAVTTPSDTGGIFQQNVSKIPRVTRLPYYDQKGEQSGHFYVQAGTDQAWIEDYNKTIIDSDLRKRAWVFQEWRLSRRILALSNQGMFLQCQSRPPRSLDGHTVGYVRRKLRNLNVNSSEESILYSWENVVEEYSGLELTKFEEDRLVALAGMAREYGRALARHAARYDEQQHKYLCGLWIGWSRGLLWEQADSYRQTRTKGFPSWSWLSIASVSDTETTGATDNTLSGLQVQWSSPTPYFFMYTLRMHEYTVCEFLPPILVPVTDDWRPIFEEAGQHKLQDLHRGLHSDVHRDTHIHRDLQNRLYSNDIRFAILPMVGKKLDICLDYHFENREDADIAAKMTAHEPKNRPSPDSSRSWWRKVSLKSSRNIIIGWASVEHPGLQGDQTFTSTTPIYAFVVSKLAKAPGGFGLGHLSGLHTVFMVLYIRAVEIVGRSDCYERIGVGRLFGDNVDEEFELSRVTEINLI